MRKLILSLIVVVVGFSAVQDAQAFRWRSIRWRPRGHSMVQPNRPRPGEVYYDSGIAFNYESGGRYQSRYPHETGRSRIYYDSGIAFEYDRPGVRASGQSRYDRTQRGRIYYDSGIAFEE